MFSKRIFSSFAVIEIALTLIVLTLTYLPNLRKATIYRDDWYYTVDRMIGGPQTFHEMFRIDRPARGYFFEAYYRLFGVEPAPYHMATFVWRLLLGLSTLWLFSLIWPKHRQAVLLITILFLIFPGYTRWMEGMEDQPKVASLFLEVTSFALTIQAMRASRTFPRVMLWAGSILTGWGYIALVDYAIGMEAFRFLCAFALVNRDSRFRSWIQKGFATLRAAAPGTLVLGCFLFWRFIIFHNERPETDLKMQLSKTAADPISGMIYWLTHYIQSVVNGAVLAWGGDGIQPFFKLSNPQMLIGLLITLTVAGCTLFSFLWMRKLAPDEQGLVGADADVVPWQVEAIGIGFFGLLAGVVPVVLANRAVEFGILSHYGLPAALASATLLGGLICSIASHRLRLTTIVIVVLLAELTQYTTSTIQANEEKIVGNFWHQVAWRAPAIREATSLLVYYPSVPIGEDVDFVHGPANFIYFPQTTNEMPVRYKLFAIKQYNWTVKEFLVGGKYKDGYRTHYGVIDYGYVLAITQPTVDSCVHIVDQRWPWYSYNDPDSILVVGQQSNIRNVRPDEAPAQVSETLFGPEPAHEWCYTFEKADLAVQQKNWQAVVALANESASQKLEPVNSLEWMPFLQTYAYLGDEEAFIATLKKINMVRYNQVQTCNVMTNMQQAGFTFSPGIVQIIDSQVCPKAAE